MVKRANEQLVRDFLHRPFWWTSRGRKWTTLPCHHSGLASLATSVLHDIPSRFSAALFAPRWFLLMKIQQTAYIREQKNNWPILKYPIPFGHLGQRTWAQHDGAIWMFWWMHVMNSFYMYYILMGKYLSTEMICNNIFNIYLYYLYIYVHHVINYVYIISKHYTSLWHHHQPWSVLSAYRWPFWTQRFLERHGMLCASGRRVRVVGPNDFWCCKRSRFFAFYWWPKLGDFLHCCIYE